MRGEQRSILLFKEAIRTEASYKIYKYSLDSFMKFNKLKEGKYDSILAIKDKKLQEMLEDYIFHLKKGNPNTVRSMYSGVELFLVVNDKVLNWKKIKKFFPKVQKRTGKEAWTTEQIQQLLDAEKSLRNRAMIHFLASTSCRIGVITELRLGNMHEMDDCKCFTIYEDTDEEYYTFTTPEASQAIDDYLSQRIRDGEKLDENSPLFRAAYKLGSEPVKPMSYQASKSIIKKLVKITKIEREKQGNRYNIQLNHGFRKRMNTILKQNTAIPYAVTERLLGHRQGLDKHYLDLKPHDLFPFFQKAIKDLTISDTERQKLTIKKLEAEKTELEELKEHIAKLEHMIESKKEPLSVQYMRLKYHLKESTTQELIDAIERGEDV